MALRVASRDNSVAVVGFPTRCPTPGSSLGGGMVTPALAAAAAAARDVVPKEVVPRSGLPNTFTIGALVCTIGVLEPSDNRENIVFRCCCTARRYLFFAVFLDEKSARKMPPLKALG